MLASHTLTFVPAPTERLVRVHLLGMRLILAVGAVVGVCDCCAVDTHATYAVCAVVDARGNDEAGCVRWRERVEAANPGTG